MAYQGFVTHGIGGLRRGYQAPRATTGMPVHGTYQGDVVQVDVPTHTSTPNPVALSGEVQDSPGNLDTRRGLLQALAVERARQGLGGAATNRRLAGVGQGANIQDIQGLSDQQYTGLLRALTRGRGRPASSRYSSLFQYFQ